MSQQTTAMPELPEPSGVITVGTQALRAFTADQMQAYALATLQAQPAAVSDAEIDRICYLATEIRFAKTDDAAQAVIDQIRAILALRPQSLTYEQWASDATDERPFVQGLRPQAESEARKAAQEQLYAERERQTAEVKRLQAEIGQLQSLRPQAVPMTLAEVSEAHVKAPYTSNDSFYSIFSCGVRAAEAHHGITAQTKEGGA